VPTVAVPEVLHYTGSDDDHGGIISVVRSLAATKHFHCVLGVNRGCIQRREPSLPALELPPVKGEKIGLLNFYRARAVAQEVAAWLREDAGRVFHGHSRAGLLVALWLRRMAEPRVVVSVHCYGRQRWFYRWAARALGGTLYWLTPQMRRYYGLPDMGWAQCLPGGVADDYFAITPAGAERGKLRLGGAGSFARWKRWELVLHAMARLPEELRSCVTFEHIGGVDGDPRSTHCRRELEKLTSVLGLTGQIAWRGSEQSSHRLLASVDLLVVPSHNEPYSMVIQEALAAGVPVLAAASGGPLDVITPGVNGLFFRDGDPAALAAALQKWLQDPPRFEQSEIRGSARRVAEVAGRWTEIYATLQ
jgi:glycosyltransferase involved in cell wall biosynthesis